MEFRILGPLEAWHGDRRLPLAGERRCALLALLLLHANRVVPKERLIDDLWGADLPATGAKALQMHVSELRKVLQIDSPEPVLVTRAPGYLIVVEPDALDLERFGKLIRDGEEALERAAPADAANHFREALALWRGEPLAEFRFAPFARAAAGRLEELRLAVLEKRIEADLALGRHADLVPELEALISESPFRERLRGQLMLALYRAGRQAEALSAYQEARRTLADELGIEPGQPLQQLQRSILRQDRALELVLPEVDMRPRGRWQPASPERSILVVPTAVEKLDTLIAIAEPLTRRPRREIIVAALVPDDRELERAARFLEQRRASLLERGVAARAAAFTTDAWGADVVRLAAEQDVDLLVVESPADLLAHGTPPPELGTVLGEAPCDVGVLVPREEPEPVGGDRPVIVPFGGSEHEWSAVEVGAWIAAAHGATLRLAGAAASPARGRRDASRLLAGVSLIVQRVTGISAEPLLVPPGEASLLAAANDAGLLVVGLSDRWQGLGLGAGRLSLARDAAPPTLFVRRGVRPGGLTPPEHRTRYTWSLGDSGPEQTP